MANVKISQLPSTGSPQGAGLIPIVQDGTTYSTTASDLVALAAGGVSSFNTRTGAVTLESGDVTGALGYTPVSPTTLSTDLADYVPKTTELTINGTTQDLSTNRTWTIATGPATVALQGQNINAGDAVIINDDGTVSSVSYNTTVTPSADTSLWNTPVYQGLYNGLNGNYTLNLVNPNDPTMVVTIFIDNSNYLFCFLNEVPENGQPFVKMPNATMNTIYSNASQYGLSAQWDPFYPDRFLVMFMDTGNNLLIQYVYVNNVWDNNGYVYELRNLYSTINLQGGVQNASFQFSVKYPNLITLIYSDANMAYYPVARTCVFYQQQGNINYNMSSAVYLSTSLSAYGNTSISRLEGEDKFTYTFSNYDSNLVHYVSYNYIWEFDTYNGHDAPGNVVSSAYNLIDYNIPAYTYGVNRVRTIFIDSSRIAYAFWYYQGMDVVNGMLIATYSGITISSLGSIVTSTPYSYPNIISGSTQWIQSCAYDKNYILWTYNLYDSVPAAYIPTASLMKINGTTPSSFSTNVVLNLFNSAPNYVYLGTYCYQSFIINISQNGIANIFYTYQNTNTGVIMSATVPFTYINQLFNSQNLLGIAQNTVVTTNTVNVLPFGGVDTNQTNLTAGTYYLQSDGTLTQFVTPYLFGRAIDATTIKTANYPTI